MLKLSVKRHLLSIYRSSIQYQHFVAISTFCPTIKSSARQAVDIFCLTNIKKEKMREKCG